MLKAIFINHRSTKLDLYENDTLRHEIQSGEIYTHTPVSSTNLIVKEGSTNVGSLDASRENQVLHLKSGGATQPQSLYFNGSDTLVKTALAEPVEGITHELWFKTHQADGGLFMCTSENRGGHDRHIYLKNGNVFARVWKHLEDEIIHSKNLTLNDGKWHHVAHTIGSRGQFLYIDGVKVAQGNKQRSAFDWQDTIVVGKSYDATRDNFNGYIREVRLWGIERSQAEIQEDMHKNLLHPQTGLLCSWPMNEETGAVIDYSGNNQNGTIQGTVSRQTLSYSMKFINRSQFDVKAYSISGSTLIHAFDLQAGNYYELQEVNSDYVFKTGAGEQEQIVEAYFSSSFDKEFIIGNTLAGIVNYLDMPLDLYRKIGDQEQFVQTLGPKEQSLLENVNRTPWLCKAKELQPDRYFPKGITVYGMDATMLEKTVEIRNTDIEAYIASNPEGWGEAREITIVNNSGLDITATLVNLEGKDATPFTIQKNESKKAYTKVGALFYIKEYFCEDLIDSFVVTYTNRTYEIQAPSYTGTPSSKIQFVNETSLEVEVYLVGENEPISPFLGKNQSVTYNCFPGQLFIAKDRNSNVVLKAMRGSYLPKIHRVRTRDLKSKTSSLAVQLNLTNHFGFPIEVYWVDFAGKPQFSRHLEDGQNFQFSTVATYAWIFLKRDTHEEVGCLIASETLEQFYSLQLKSPEAHPIKTSDLRSEGGGAAINLTVINQIGFPIDVYWADFQGGLHLYAALYHNQSYNQSTSDKHTWVFFKRGTQEAVGVYTATQSPQQTYTLKMVSVKLVNPTRDTLLVSQVSTDGSWLEKGTLGSYNSLELHNIPDLSYLVVRSNSQPTYVIDTIQVMNKSGLLDANGFFVHKVRTAHLRSVGNGSPLNNITFANNSGQAAKLYSIDRDGNWDFKDEILNNGNVNYRNDNINALFFDGTSTHVNIPLNEPETGITHEFWFKTWNPNGGLMCASEGSLHGAYDRDLYLKGGNIFARLYTEETISSESVGLSLHDNQWHHVAHVIGHDGQQLYVDGKLVAKGNKGNSDFNWQTHLTLGHSPRSNPGFFQGYLYKVRVWQKPLVASEINTLIYEGALGSIYNGYWGADIGLIGEWYLDDGSGTTAQDTADNASKHHGTIYGANWHSVARFLEQSPIHSNYRYVAISKPITPALRFNGINTSLLVEYNEPETEITHELWFRTSKPNGGLLMCRADDLAHDRHLYLRDGNIFARVWNDETIGSTGLYLNDNQWHHVAHTLGSGGQFLYIDGVKVASGSKQSSNFTWQTHISIGESWDSPQDFFEGNIAQVRFWDRVLSQQEIQEKMTKHLSALEPGLKRYWPMNDYSNQIKEVMGSTPLTWPSQFTARDLTDNLPLSKKYEVLQEWTPMKASLDGTTVRINRTSGTAKDSGYAPNAGEVVVYQENNFGGQGTLVTGNVSDASFLGTIRSMKVGPETEVSFFSSKHFNGEEITYHFDQETLSSTIQSLHLEHVVSEKVVGISSKSSLTEEYLYFDANGVVCTPDTPNSQLQKCHAYQTILTVPPTAKKVEVLSLNPGEEVKLIVDHEVYTVDYVSPKYFSPNALSKIVISELLLDKNGNYVRDNEPQELTTPGLRVRTNQMPKNEYIHVFPDSDMYKTTANLKDGHLYESAQAGKLGNNARQLSKESCGHIQKALQNLGKTAHHTYEKTRHGVRVHRVAKPHSMEHPHWELAFDDTNG
ncbi:MAG: hypothetical protein F6K08_16360, partial [Okeania sp. SIO1H6]|nr:hypothetical protein [Okeania sp. SIO1H6]